VIATSAYGVLARLSKIGRPGRFEFDAQSISDAIDIVEVRGDLVRIDDTTVV